MQELNTKYNKKHIKVVKNIFYRPNDISKDKKAGWVTNWQLIYKEQFSKKVLYSKEETDNTKQEAQLALKKYTYKQLLMNIAEFILDES